MDSFGIHPYQDNSSTPPSFAHPLNSTIAIADYDKLVKLLGQAFDGTAQPGSTLPIFYGEFGVETIIPAEKSALYTGVEPASVRPVDNATQAAYYREALAMAFCQPNVKTFLFFHAVDEIEPRPLAVRHVLRGRHAEAQPGGRRAGNTRRARRGDRALRSAQAVADREGLLPPRKGPQRKSR